MYQNVYTLSCKFYILTTLRIKCQSKYLAIYILLTCLFLNSLFCMQICLFLITFKAFFFFELVLLVSITSYKQIKNKYSTNKNVYYYVYPIKF